MWRDVDVAQIGNEIGRIIGFIRAERDPVWEGVFRGLLEGRQPVELTARTLLRLSDLPIEWAEQRAMLGFP